MKMNKTQNLILMSMLKKKKKKKKLRFYGEIGVHSLSIFKN